MMKSILSLFLLTGAIYSADLSRNSNGTVIDISTNLEWQDNISSVIRTWSKAISYCEALSLGGKDDWRLPNRNELISIVDYSKLEPAIKENIFQNISSDLYWSSSSHAGRSSEAWRVDFSKGGVYDDSKTYGGYVRCVKARQ